jgi:SRSO17 transposase
VDDDEGRNWTGRHHHVTLVTLAHAFLTLEVLGNKKTSGWTLAQSRRAIQRLLFTWTAKRA